MNRRYGLDPRQTGKTRGSDSGSDDAWDARDTHSQGGADASCSGSVCETLFAFGVGAEHFVGGENDGGGIGGWRSGEGRGDGEGWGGG